MKPQSQVVFELMVKVLFVLTTSMFAFAAIAGWVLYRDSLTLAAGALNVVILSALGIWAWGKRPQPLASASEKRMAAEIVTDADLLEIPKDDYLASVIALGDKMASPDPQTRQLAVLAYDAFKSSVKPTGR